LFTAWKEMHTSRQLVYNLERYENRTLFISAVWLDSIVEQLESMISGGHIATGQRLPAERALRTIGRFQTLAAVMRYTSWRQGLLVSRQRAG